MFLFNKMLILFKQSWTDEERRFFRSEPKAPASYAALMAHRYRHTHTQIQTHLYRSFIQRIQFPRILFLGCDFGLHIREILPSLRIWHTFTISFRVCVCAYVTHIRSHVHRHTHAPTTTTKRDEICVTRWTAPKKGNIFFIIPLWGACKSGNPQYTTASCARSVCNHQAKHTPRRSSAPTWW